MSRSFLWRQLLVFITLAGDTDQSVAINSFLSQAASIRTMAYRYFPAGIYIIEDTIYVTLVSKTWGIP